MKKEAPQIQHWITGCMQNNYQAQVQVYEHFKEALYNASWRILRNDTDTQDVVHDAFIKGFQNIHQLGGNKDLGAWLKKIAINRSLDLLRRKQHISWQMEMSEMEILAEDEPFPAPALSIHQVMEGIQQLPEKYRIVVILFLIEDYKHKEIASLLGMNESTVRNRFLRGKSKLKEILKLKQNQ